MHGIFQQNSTANYYLFASSFNGPLKKSSTSKMLNFMQNHSAIYLGDQGGLQLRQQHTLSFHKIYFAAINVFV